MSFLVYLPASSSRKLLLYVETFPLVSISHLQWFFSVVSSFLESDLVQFDSIPEPDDEKLIKLWSSKSCTSDPLPTWMVKQCLPVLLPFITNTVNLSLSTSTLHNQFKSAVITPILKKSSCDPNVIKNFRPVANNFYFKGCGKNRSSANFNTLGEEWFEWHLPVCLQKNATVRRRHFFACKMIYW